METKIVKKEILPHFLYSFTCEKKFIDSLLDYNLKVDWDQIKSRKLSSISKNNNFKYGKSFYPGKRGFIELEEFKLFNKWLENCFSKVVEELNWTTFQNKNLKITQSWLNNSKSGECHHLHRHSFSILSGILYLSHNSSTQFFIPSIYSLPSVISNIFDNKVVLKHHYEGEKGELIIFPSSLEHCVGPNMQKEPRISLSMNTWPLRDFGSPKSLAFIPQEINNY